MVSTQQMITDLKTIESLDSVICEQIYQHCLNDTGSENQILLSLDKPKAVFYLNWKKEYEYKEVLKKAAPEQQTADDMFLSQLYADLFRNEVCYNTTAKCWYYYDGIKWVPDEGRTMALNKARQIKNLLIGYSAGLESDVAQKNLITIAQKMGNYNRRTTLVDDARSLMAITYSDFDKDPDLFNCLNCTINLKTMQIFPHNPKDMISKVCGCNYNPSADKSKWQQFIKSIMQGNTDKMNYLQRIIGYGMTAENSIECAFFLYGATTRNGKGTLVSSIARMMGDYAGTAQPELLAQTKRNGSSATPDIASLAGIRYLNISEPKKNMLLDVALFKTLTGRDTISARRLYEMPFEFVPQFKLFMNCNYLPAVTDNTVFQSERIRIITFDKHFTKKEQNPNLKNELQTDDVLSGVLLWALEGLQEFTKNGEQPPKCVLDATTRYKADTDKILKYISDCMEPAEKVNTSAADAYKSFEKWCSKNGYALEGKTVFMNGLREHDLLSDSGTISGKTVRNVIKGYQIIE